MQPTTGVGLLLLGVVLVLAGCSTPVADAPPEDPFADPSRDVEGWEDGYWADEPLDVTAGDGLDGSERAAVVARSMARVEVVRHVEFGSPVSVAVVSREEFAAGSVGSSDGASPERRYRNARLEALFLVGERTSGGEASEQNDQRSIQGYYSVRRDRVVIVSPTETPRIDEGVLAQELFHAYQFRTLLPDRVPGPITFDRRRAIVSVVEGDANLVQRRYERRCGRNWTCVTEGEASSENGTGSQDGGNARGEVDLSLYLLQYFPYAEGEAYVRAIQRSEGWAGVAERYEELPATTAEVIDGEGPTTPRQVQFRRPPGGDWTRVDRQGHDYVTVGESGLASMFAATLYDDREGSVVNRSAFLDRGGPTGLNYSLAPSRGWAGDRLTVYRDGDRTAYRFRIRFGDAGGAERFLATYRELLSYHGGRRLGDGRWRIPDGPYADAFALTRSGTTVTVVNAPTTADLAALRVESEDPAPSNGTDGR